MAYNVYKEEIRRYIRICNNHYTLMDKCLLLEKSLLQKGYSKIKIFDNFTNVIKKKKKKKKKKKNANVYTKYGIDADTILFEYSWPDT